MMDWARRWWPGRSMPLCIKSNNCQHGDTCVFSVSRMQASGLLHPTTILLMRADVSLSIPQPFRPAIAPNQPQLNSPRDKVAQRLHHIAPITPCPDVAPG